MPNLNPKFTELITKAKAARTAGDWESAGNHMREAMRLPLTEIPTSAPVKSLRRWGFKKTAAKPFSLFTQYNPQDRKYWTMDPLCAYI